MILNHEAEGRRAAQSVAFMGTLSHAAANFLGQLGRVVFCQAVHDGFHQDTLWAAGNVHFGIAYLDAAAAQLVLIIQGVPAVTGYTVILPGYEGVETVQLGVVHHELEVGALIIAARHVAIYVFFYDHIAVGPGVGQAVTALALNALFGLTAARRVAIVSDGGEHGAFILHKILHKKSPFIK